MDYLKEIISIVDKNKSKQIEIVGQDSIKDRKLHQLYEGILMSEYKSDSQACRKLYGTNDLDKGYRNLKSRLEKRVLNTLFFIDVNLASYSDPRKAYFQCYKNMAAVKFLVVKGGKKSSIKLAEKTLKKALQYEFYDVAIPLLKDLRQYYGTLRGDQKKMRKYNDLLQQIMEASSYEEKARGMYDMLASQFVRSKTIKPFHIRMAREFSEELEPDLDKTNFRNFHFYAHLILVLRYEIENDPPQTIIACDRALSYFNKIGFITQNQTFTFLFKRFTSHIQLKNYETAGKDAQTCLELVEEGTWNWILASQFYMVLLFHSGRIQESFEFYKKVKSVIKKKRIISEEAKQFWNLIEAYIDYFIRVGEIVLPAQKRKPRFDFDTFIKGVPTFKKDKRGMNISVIVLQLLFNLQQKKYDEVIMRTEALESYSSRYLRQNDTFRSNCFIRMLLEIPAANFNRTNLERRAEKLYEKLISKPLEIAEQPQEVEIVPYEVLWEFVLSSMNTSTKKIKS